MDLADAPPRHTALPPLDASVIDATHADGTDAMPTTRLPDAPERVSDATGDALRALRDIFSHAPAGLKLVTAKARQPIPDAHPDAWLLEVMRPETQAHAPAYIRERDRQAELLVPIREKAEKERKAHVTGLAVLAGAVVLAVAVGFLWFTTLLCLVGPIVATVAAFALGVKARRVAELERVAASERVADADPTRVGDAPPPRVELTRETITGALRNAGVIGDAVEIVVRPATPMRSNGEPNGWKVRVELPPTVKGGAGKALAAREFIAFAFDKEPSCVVLEPVKDRGLAFDMWVAERDPMACAPVISPMVEATRSNIHRPCLVGYAAGGERVMVQATDDIHGLLTGATGSGKSSLAALLAANEALYPFGYPIIIDPQHSSRWAPYREIGVVISGTDPDDQRLAARTLEWLAGPEMNRRGLAFAAHLEAHPLASPEDIVTAEMMALKHLGLFHILVTIDEAHTVLGFSAPIDPHDDSSPTCAQVINDAVQQIVTRSRRIGMNAVLVTQRGSTTNVKGDIRAILNSKGCFSVADDETATMGLGPGWKAAGMDPVHGLSTKYNKGACYIHGEWLKSPERSWVLAKMDHIDVTGHRLICGRGRKLRQDEAPWVLAWRPAPVLEAERRTARAAAAPPAPSTAQLLEALRAVLEPEGSLHAPAIVARLGAEDPAYLSCPATREGLDALVAPLELRCVRFQRAGRRDYGLKFSGLPNTVPGTRQSPASGSEVAG